MMPETESSCENDILQYNTTQLIVGKHEHEARLAPGNDVRHELILIICLWSLMKMFWFVTHTTYLALTPR